MQISETFLKNNMTYLAHFNMVELMDDTIPCLWIWITKRNPWPWVQTWTQEPRSLKHYLWWPTIQCNLSTPASTAKVGRYSTSTQRKSRKLKRKKVGSICCKGKLFHQSAFVCTYTQDFYQKDTRTLGMVAPGEGDRETVLSPCSLWTC